MPTCRKHTPPPPLSDSTTQVRVFNAGDVSADLLDASECDWTLFVERVNDSRRLFPLRVRLAYNSATFSRARIEDTLAQLQLVVGRLVETPEATVGSVSIVTDGAREILPDNSAPLDTTWRGAPFEYLTKHAVATPERPLIVHGATTYTYGQIEQLSNQLANYLVASGIEPEERVALYAHRSSALVVGIMGILKSAATFTVVDPAYPTERQIVYLKVAQPRGVVTLAAAGALDPAVQTYIDSELDLKCQLNGLGMEADSGPLADQPTTVCGRSVGPESIGTLSFTSGSTGIPKAVRGRHVSLTHFYPWMSEEFGLGPEDRFSMLSGIAHDPIQRDVFTPIFFGAAIHIPDAADIGNPGALAEWMRTHAVTVTHLTPAMGQVRKQARKKKKKMDPPKTR